MLYAVVFFLNAAANFALGIAISAFLGRRNLAVTQR